MTGAESATKGGSWSCVDIRGTFKPGRCNPARRAARSKGTNLQTRGGALMNRRWIRIDEVTRTEYFTTGMERRAGYVGFTVLSGGSGAEKPVTAATLLPLVPGRGWNSTPLNGGENLRNLLQVLEPAAFCATRTELRRVGLLLVNSLPGISWPPRLGVPTRTSMSLRENGDCNVNRHRPSGRAEVLRYSVFDCPVLVLCDYPPSPWSASPGDCFVINPDAKRSTVAVEASTWTSVKSLCR